MQQVKTLSELENLKKRLESLIIQKDNIPGSRAAQDSLLFREELKKTNLEISQIIQNTPQENEINEIEGNKPKDNTLRNLLLIGGALLLLA